LFDNNFNVTSWAIIDNRVTVYKMNELIFFSYKYLCPYLFSEMERLNGSIERISDMLKNENFHCYFVQNFGHKGKKRSWCILWILVYPMDPGVSYGSYGSWCILWILWILVYPIDPMDPGVSYGSYGSWCILMNANRL
jgi:hypothetical protein